MADARQESDWSRTASVMALIANCNRDPKQRREPFAPQDFTPDRFRRRARQTPPPMVGIEALKVFVPKKD